MNAPSASWENTLYRIKEIPTLNKVYLYLAFPFFPKCPKLLKNIKKNCKKEREAWIDINVQD